MSAVTSPMGPVGGVTLDTDHGCAAWEHLPLLETLNTTPFCVGFPELVSVAETRSPNRDSGTSTNPAHSHKF